MNHDCYKAYKSLKASLVNDKHKMFSVEEFSLYDTDLVSESRPSSLHISTSPVLSSPKSKAILNTFERVFAMWEAGEDKRKVFNDLYAFPPVQPKLSHLAGKNLFELECDMPAPVNLSREYADFFLSCLASQAKYINGISSNITSANKSRFFLVGDIGTGKTTFINYIFSRHYEELRRIGVMWIRIDLTKSYHGVKTLDDSASFQLARIIRKCYYKKYFHSDPEFLSTIKQQFSNLIKTQEISDEKVSEWIADYISKYDSERTYPYHPLVQKGVRQYVHRRFAMIYLYDGLDRLRRGDDFDNKMQEIQDHILGSEKRKHIYFFVMRSTSHADVLNKYLTAEEYSLAALRRVSKTFQVIPPKLSQIVNNRLNVLCKIWDNLLYEERHRVLEPNIEDYALKEDVNLEELQQLMHKCKWMGESADLKAYYRIFLLFIYRGLSLSDIDLSDADISNSHEMSIKAFRALKNVVGSNFRILLSVLVHLLKCFLLVLEQLELDENNIIALANVLDDHKTKWDITDLKRILARHYRVVTTLLRERTIYKHPFSYRRNVSGKLMPNLDRNVPYIFNIFRGVNLTNKRKETFHLLAKIRILQLLKQKEFRDKDVLIQFIAETFGYSKENLLFDLEELRTIGLVSRIRKSNDNGDLYYEFSISRSGKYMIDTLIFEYSFLEIILNDIFIPKCFSKYFILT